MRILNSFELVVITRHREVPAQRKVNVFLSIAYPRRYQTNDQILIYATTRLQVEKKQSAVTVIGLPR